MATSISSSSSLTTRSSLALTEYSEEAYKILRVKYLAAKFPHQDPLRRPFMHGLASWDFYLEWYKDSISSSSKSASSLFFASSSSSKSASASKYPLHRLAHSSSQAVSSSSSASSSSEAEITKIDLGDLTQNDVDRITEAWLRVNFSSSITQQFAGVDILSMVPKIKLEEKINTLQSELNKDLRNSSCLSPDFLGYYLGFGSLAQKAQDINDLEYVKERIYV